MTEQTTRPPDRRVTRTRTALESAFVQLSEELDFTQISPAAVAARAGVSRSTFYDHYDNIHELASSACTAMIDELLANVLEIGGGAVAPLTTAPPSLHLFFSGLFDHARMYRHLLGPDGSAHVIGHVRTQCTSMIGAGMHPGSRDSPADHGGTHCLACVYAASALVGVAVDWVVRDCPGSASLMAAHTWPLLVHTLSHCDPPTT